MLLNELERKKFEIKNHDNTDLSIDLTTGKIHIKSEMTEHLSDEDIEKINEMYLNLKNSTSMIVTDEDDMIDEDTLNYPRLFLKLFVFNALKNRIYYRQYSTVIDEMYKDSMNLRNYEKLVDHLSMQIHPDYQVEDLDALHLNKINPKDLKFLSQYFSDLASRVNDVLHDY